jgi:hypothetical protein
MKLNRSLLMTAVMAASIFAGGSLAQAQDTNTPTPPPPPGAPGGGMRAGRPNFDMIAKQLELTEDQKPKVKPIIEDMQKQTADVRADSSIAPPDKRTKYKEIRDATTAKLKDILTPDQLAKWEKMGPGNRRPPGAMPPPPPVPPASGDTTPKSDTTK